MKKIKITTGIISALMAILGFLNLFEIFPTILDKIKTLPNSIQLLLKIIVIVASMVYLFFVIISYIYKKNEHILMIGTRKYYSYFNKWYDKTGDIKIFCGNLRWINDNNLKATLTKKSQRNELSIYISNEDQNSKMLENSGAKVYVVNEEYLISLSFSIKTVDGSSSYIIRYNTEDDHDNREVKIKVHEMYNDPEIATLQVLSNIIEKKFLIVNGR